MALTAIDIAAGPGAFAARKIIMASPLGRVIETKTAQFAAWTSNYISGCGVDPGRAAKVAGAIVFLGGLAFGAHKALEMFKGVRVSLGFGRANRSGTRIGQGGTTNERQFGPSTRVDGEAGNPDPISTARPGQSRYPRTTLEQHLWRQVEGDPTIGTALKGLDGDPRFPTNAGWQKMQAVLEGDSGNITMHYQYNSRNGTLADMKIIENTVEGVKKIKK